MNRKQVDEIFFRFHKKLQEPKIELDYKSPYTLLVAVVLSAQSTDKGVNRVTPALFEAADTPQKMVDLGEEGLKEYIKSLGLYNSKARNLIKASQIILDDFDGEVPDNMVDLQKLPGVGRKSANVMLNCIHSMPTIAVDTHVFRVSNRIGLCKTTTPHATEIALEKAIPKHWKSHAHHWLVLHGRYTCKARKPECAKCLINDLCEYPNKLL